MTLPCCGFSLAESGMMIPPIFCSPSSRRRTMIRSCSGLTSMTSPPEVGVVCGARCRRDGRQAALLASRAWLIVLCAPIDARGRVAALSRQRTLTNADTARHQETRCAATAHVLDAASGAGLYSVCTLLSPSLCRITAPGLPSASMQLDSAGDLRANPARSAGRRAAAGPTAPVRPLRGAGKMSVHNGTDRRGRFRHAAWRRSRT